MAPAPLPLLPPLPPPWLFSQRDLWEAGQVSLAEPSPLSRPPAACLLSQPRTRQIEPPVCSPLRSRRCNQASAAINHRLWTLRRAAPPATDLRTSGERTNKGERGRVGVWGAGEEEEGGSVRWERALAPGIYYRPPRIQHGGPFVSMESLTQCIFPRS